MSTLGIAAAAMKRAMQSGYLFEARQAKRPPELGESVAAGLLVIMSDNPDGRWGALINGMSDEEKIEVMRALSSAVEDLAVVHKMMINVVAEAARSRIPPEIAAIAENHECERCPAYEKCDLPSVSDGGPRKDLAPGEWKPVKMDATANLH